MSQVDAARSAVEPETLSLLRSLLTNALRMSLLWAAFGVLVGVGTTPAGEGWIGPVAGAIAGVIVLAPIGMILGLFGARRVETSACAAGGLCVGGIAGLATSGDPIFLASSGLIFGGLLGATVVAVFYRLPRLLLSRLTPRV